MWTTLKKKIDSMIAAFMCIMMVASVLGLTGGSMAWEQPSEELLIQRQAIGPIGPGANLIGSGGSFLGGARLTLLANQTASQMLSAVIETKKGSLIVIDGGTPGDADHLLETIRAKGGRVSAWLVTHPHSDHVGALTSILSNPDSQIQIDNLYYSLTDLSWYQTYESYRADTVEAFMKALSGYSPEKLHSNLVRGEQIKVDDVTITVMNQPYLIETNSINNSSVAYDIEVNGKYILFLGDMGPEAGARFLADYAGQTIPCDIVQMAHHGQYGVNEDVYQKLQPKICLWPTPQWLWDNDNGGGYNSGSYLTLETRQWMEKLGVTANYCIKDGDQILE